MFDKDENEDFDYVLPELDEGWWNSVLSDENAYSSETKQINCKPCQQTSANAVNWECIQNVFENDEVVLLNVDGFNRGGLLVEGEDIKGFVPISHIIDAPINPTEEERHKFLEGYVGRSLYLKVIECEPSSERVVL